MDIPKARARILYNDANGKLLGIDNLIEVLNNIRRDSLFYKFTDKKLYNKITEINQQIEDRLVKIKHLSPEESDKVLEFLNDNIEELYKVIMKSYRGK